MLVLAVVAVLVARFIERSWIGRGLAALRDNEEAAECMGVPTLRLKLFATTISGFLLGVAGAPFPYYVTFVEPNVRLQPRLRGERAGHADDRRHHDAGSAR